MFNMAQCNCLLDKTKFYDSKETRTMQSCKLKCCKIISAAKIQLVALRNQANVAMIKYLALFSFNQKKLSHQTQSWHECDFRFSKISEFALHCLSC